MFLYLVIVDEPTNFRSTSSFACKDTLISFTSPFFKSISSSEILAVKGSGSEEFSMAILFSVHSVNHTWLFFPIANCRALAMPPHNILCEGILYSTNEESLGSKRASLFPICSLNHNIPSGAILIQYGREYALSITTPLLVTEFGDVEYSADLIISCVKFKELACPMISNPRITIFIQYNTNR